MNITSRPVLRAATALAGVFVLLGTASCAGGSDDKATPFSAAADTDDSGGVSANLRQVPAEETRDGLTSLSDGSTAKSFQGTDAVGAPAAEPIQRAVISTGNLHVEGTKLVEVRSKALSIVDGLGGTVADEKSGSDDRGRLEQVSLTLRVPGASFTQALDRLADLGTLRERNQSATDVTTQVIDTAAKIKAQRASVESIERLLARANTIGEIMSVEAQLTRRQAELDSLVQQQKFLADQTSLSTIQLLLSKPEPGAAKDEDNDGFLGGLESGWNALGDSFVAVGTVLGAALPFAAVLALFGFPAWAAYRRFRGSRLEPEPSL